MKLRSSLNPWTAALAAPLALVVPLLASIASTAHADEVVAVAEVEEEDEAPNLGAFSVTFDNSFTTAYMFRGIMNVRDGLIWQPSLGLGMNLFEAEEGVVTSVDLGFGIWASYQTENYSGIAGTDGLYEVDYYPSLSVEWCGQFTTALTYYDYTSPNDTFRDVDEIAVDLSYDDSELLGAFAMNPTATFAFETHNTSFGTGKGAVFEFALEPSVEFEIPGAEDYPIGLTFPFKMGLSMDEYYNDNAGEDDTFGYARLGLHAGVPIACIPARFGAWSVTNGFDVYFLGDALEAYNQSDEVYPVWTSSITMEY
jgi:hypothetical protein